MPVMQQAVCVTHRSSVPGSLRHRWRYKCMYCTSTLVPWKLSPAPYFDDQSLTKGNDQVSGFRFIRLSSSSSSSSSGIRSSWDQGGAIEGRCPANAIQSNRTDWTGWTTDWRGPHLRTNLSSLPHVRYPKSLILLLQLWTSVPLGGTYHIRPNCGDERRTMRPLF